MGGTSKPVAPSPSLPPPITAAAAIPKWCSVKVGAGWFYLGATMALLGDERSATAAYWKAFALDKTKVAGK